MDIPIDIFTDTLTDAELDALADEAELAKKGDAFLAALEAVVKCSEAWCI